MKNIRDKFEMSVLVYTMVLLLLPLKGANAHEHFSGVEVTTHEVSNNIYMLQGEGGNVGVSVGDDGVLIIDDQFVELNQKILAAIKALTSAPVKFVLNTHWHFDHSGGNAAFGEGGAIIVAHDNVRNRLLTGAEIAAFNRVIPPAPQSALPDITFAEGITLHWNGDTVKLIHMNAAHTDGDSVIFFEQANVVHTGDLYFNGFYPFIDTSSEGSFAGMIKGVNKILALIDDNTQVIPGHGPLSNKRELIAYRDMLSVLYKQLSVLKAQGRSVEEVVAAKPTQSFDAQWGNGLLPPDQWVRIAFEAI